MGLFDAFGKKFEDQVQEAIASVAARRTAARSATR